jgi:hypothetical protein
LPALQTNQTSDPQDDLRHESNKYTICPFSFRTGVASTTITPGAPAERSDGQQDAKDPEDFVIPENVPGMFQYLPNIDHFKFSFLCHRVL